MDGAAMVSDLVGTISLSDFLCGACLASLNPAGWGWRGGSHPLHPHHHHHLYSLLFKRLPPLSRGDSGDNH